MKKIRGVPLCYALSALLILGFVINTILDYSRYSSTLNSAPFYLWVVVNALCFLVPAAIFLLLGIVLKNRQRKSANKTAKGV